jgi:hypothetical protein
VAIEPGKEGPVHDSEQKGAEDKPSEKSRPSAEEVANQAGDYREFLRKQAEASRARLGAALADKLKKK